MDISTLFPLLLTGAGTGLSCGINCGACGNPMINVFLAGYLFTHTDRMKKSIIAFFGYHTGKAVTVSILCMLVSWFGSRIVDEQGNLFGMNLHRIVYAVMLMFMIALIFRWFRENRGKAQKNCDRGCGKHQKTVKNRCGSMMLYGLMSGLSPCASLLVVLSYASSLTIWEAVLVGLSFSLANSLIPLILLTVLTGVLSEQMHKEIPAKIQYFRLAVYMLFACVLMRNLLSTF